ncbi:hypothetical protein GCM10022237_20610 [Nocardioides ginsengisoli]|uniref:hypothetical protein n=1 Tax=Nocardioides ginsengisoli TaxID=363868 RepID=UPI003370A893
MTSPESPERPASWTEALDRLEAHADRAEQMLRGASAAPAPPPWQPPADLGPLPNELVPRARMLLARQQRLMAAIPGALSENRRQQRVADRVVDAAAAAVTPVYLDVTA